MSDETQRRIAHSHSDYAELLARYEALQKAAEGMAEAIDGHVCDPAELARGDCSCCIAYDSYRALRKAEGDKP